MASPISFSSIGLLLIILSWSEINKNYVQKKKNSNSLCSIPVMNK